MKRSPPCFRFGISVVEVLVVMAVVAVVLVMLLPVAKSFREKGSGIRCINHLKNSYAALMAYAGDHNGTLVMHAYDKVFNPTTRRWNDFLVNGGYLDRTSNAQLCPAAAPFTYDGAGFAYGTLGWTTPDQDPASYYPSGMTNTSRGVRLSMIEKPSAYWLLTDSWSAIHQRQIYIVRFDALAKDAAIHMRHSNKANFLFADGHVSSLGRDEIAALPVNTPTYVIDQNGTGSTLSKTSP